MPQPAQVPAVHAGDVAAAEKDELASGLRRHRPRKSDRAPGTDRPRDRQQHHEQRQAEEDQRLLVPRLRIGGLADARRGRCAPARSRRSCRPDARRQRTGWAPRASPPPCPRMPTWSPGSGRCRGSARSASAGRAPPSATAPARSSTGVHGRRVFTPPTARATRGQRRQQHQPAQPGVREQQRGRTWAYCASL